VERPVDLAILLSGTGRTLKNLIDRIGDGTLCARVTVVLTSIPGVKGLQYAGEAGASAVTVPRSEYRSTRSFSEAVTRALEPHPADLVVMAGFVHLWRFPEKYRGRVLNIHPALLPKFGGKGFYGHHVHEAVLAAGERESGCTVHFADHKYDHGPTVLQRRVPVLADDTPDTLAARVFEQECEAYPEAIRKVAAKLVRPGSR
jgi:formyltetrahydrofolate-dependent phosphoribosylglycinamide formyltransferase